MVLDRKCIPFIHYHFTTRTYTSKLLKMSSLLTLLQWANIPLDVATSFIATTDDTQPLRGLGSPNCFRRQLLDLQGETYLNDSILESMVSIESHHFTKTRFFDSTFYNPHLHAWFRKSRRHIPVDQAVDAYKAGLLKNLAFFLCENSHFRSVVFSLDGWEVYYFDSLDLPVPTLLKQTCAWLGRRFDPLRLPPPIRKADTPQQPSGSGSCGIICVETMFKQLTSLAPGQNPYPAMPQWDASLSQYYRQEWLRKIVRKVLATPVPESQYPGGLGQATLSKTDNPIDGDIAVPKLEDIGDGGCTDDTDVDDTASAGKPSRLYANLTLLN